MRTFLQVPANLPAYLLVCFITFISSETEPGLDDPEIKNQNTNK